MRRLPRPLILVHGLWNKPKLFNRLKNKLSQPEDLVFSPHLPHKLGRTRIRELAFELDTQVCKQYDSDVLFDVLGFSMGGLISRLWLQEFGSYSRVRRFFSVGVPHQGTLTAQIVPYCFFPGIAEMKCGSKLIRSLSLSSSKLNLIECKSYFCKYDLMVFPGVKAVLPMGNRVEVPVLNHKALIKHPMSIDLLVTELLKDSL